MLNFIKYCLFVSVTVTKEDVFLTYNIYVIDTKTFTVIAKSTNNVERSGPEISQQNLPGLKSWVLQEGSTSVIKSLEEMKLA